jgi:hypothetical protein
MATALAFVAVPAAARAGNIETGCVGRTAGLGAPCAPMTLLPDVAPVEGTRLEAFGMPARASALSSECRRSALLRGG